MTFDDILKQITEGLSGDAEQDIAYLNEQATAYSDHEQAQEIARACGRMIYERLPEEERQKAFDAMMEEDIRPMEAALSEARALIAANDLEKAQTVLEDLVDKADDAKKRGLFQDDAMSEYYCFSEPFEEMLYMFRKKPEREVRRSVIPFADIYSLYGQLLMARGDDRAANYVLKEAVRWNPANAAISFDYAASFKKLGDMEKFMKITRGIFSYAFRPADLARCYRNVGIISSTTNNGQRPRDAFFLGCNLMKTPQTPRRHLPISTKRPTAKLWHRPLKSWKPLLPSTISH